MLGLPVSFRIAKEIVDTSLGMVLSRADETKLSRGLMITPLDPAASSAGVIAGTGEVSEVAVVSPLVAMVLALSYPLQARSVD